MRGSPEPGITAVNVTCSSISTQVALGSMNSPASE